MALEYTFKYIIIGESSVGKSCLLHQFTDHEFLENTVSTMGVEFGNRVVEINGHLVKLEIWDTAGQERFRAVARSYYRGTAGAILVYDITSRESYNQLARWLTDARNLTNPNTVMMLVGTKVDLEDKREVSYEEALRFAEENGLVLFETSAKTGRNVEPAFLGTARRILENIQNGIQDPHSSSSGIRLEQLPAEPQPNAGTSCWC
eukprot:RCo048809